jgi:hypothetical protein
MAVLAFLTMLQSACASNGATLRAQSKRNDAAGHAPARDMPAGDVGVESSHDTPPQPSGWMDRRRIAHTLATPVTSETAAMSAASAPPRIDARPAELGIQINGCDKDVPATFAQVRALGLRWIKQQARWSQIERAPGVYDWGCLDRVIGAAHRDDVNVLVSITTAPAFRRRQAIAFGMHPAHGRPDAFEDFGDFVAALAVRYAGRIHALELWNEPNLIIEWGDTLDAVNYVRLLESGYRAAKMHAPALTVISAGVAPSGFNTLWTSVDDLTYMATAIHAGLLSVSDCIGVHANGPDGVGDLDAVVTRYRTLIEQIRRDAGSAEAAPRFCVTEFGHAVPVHGQAPPGFEWSHTHTPETQVAAFVRGLAWLRDNTDVMLVIAWNLNYDGADARGVVNVSDPNALYALTRPGWSSPALAVLGAYVKQP